MTIMILVIVLIKDDDLLTLVETSAVVFGSTERARGILIDTIYKARPTYSAMFFVDKVMLTHLAPAWAPLCRGTILFKGQRNLFS